jgi:hypothetical protein
MRRKPGWRRKDGEEKLKIKNQKSKLPDRLATRSVAGRQFKIQKFPTILQINFLTFDLNLCILPFDL